MNFTSSERDYIEENEAYVPVAESEKRLIDSLDSLCELLDERDALRKESPDAKLDLRNSIIKGLDLSRGDMKGLDLSRATFEKCNLRGADFSGSKLDNVAFYKNDLVGMKLCGCLARGCSFRFQDMTDIDLRGTNIYASVLEDALNQDKVIVDDDTKWYKMRCPEIGEAFVAWKCCTDLRVVMMLVPRDAKRCMATMETGRAERVKVLKITSIDESENYSWAQSTVDPNFYYDVGKWLEPANGFEEDRWKDSSAGIHFFLDRQQCVDYQSK